MKDWAAGHKKDCIMCLKKRLRATVELMISNRVGETTCNYVGYGPLNILIGLLISTYMIVSFHS